MATAQKHTPTPWNTRDAGPFIDLIAANGDRVARVCEYGPQSETPEAQAANAALIVRAVNSHAALVEALEAAFFALGRHGANMAESVSRKEWEQARAALKLAGVQS